MTELPPSIVRMTVDRAAAGTRLDRLLADHLPGVARKRAGELIGNGRVRVDGHRYNKSYCPTVGQTIEVILGDPGHAQAAPEIELTVLLETVDLIVIDKPAGLPSAALPDSSRATAASGLLARYPEMATVGFGPREPGLIHRLDTFTSGVLVAARSQAAFDALRQALSEGTFDKRYLALVESTTIDDQGVIEVALAPDPKNRRRVRPVDPQAPGAHFARSNYRVVLRGTRWALVEVRAGAAYRHQIRAHLASRGSPLLGDALYGGPPADRGERHALHASRISGTYRLGGDLPPIHVEVQAPLPADMQQQLSDDGVKRSDVEAVARGA